MPLTTNALERWAAVLLSFGRADGAALTGAADDDALGVGVADAGGLDAGADAVGVTVTGAGGVSVAGAPAAHPASTRAAPAAAARRLTAREVGEEGTGSR